MHFNLQPRLESNLVVIRPLKPTDFDALYRAAADPLIWKQHHDMARCTTEGFAKFFMESLASKGALCLLHKKNEKIIGSSRFKIIDAAEGVVEIGWTFLIREFWGGTFNREIKRLMINHALNAAKKVVFYVNSKNLRSQKAMEKLGALRMNPSGSSWTLDESAGITYLITKKIKGNT
jgi:RimJ/RimL family protein N-acetyltransferase